MKAENQAFSMATGPAGEAQKRHAGPGCAGLAAGPKALDRAHPRHHQAAPAGREPRGGQARAEADDLREIDEAAAKIQVQGGRYPEHLEKLTGR